jgi:hypothetical protein
VSFTPNAWIALGILFTIATIAHLLIFSVIALLFSIQVLGERCLDLENQINNSLRGPYNLLRGPYLIWEHFASEIWSTNSKIVYKMPDALAAVFFYVLVLTFTVGLGGLVLLRMRCRIPSEWFNEPDTLLTLAQFLFAIYLVAVPVIAFYVNKYTYGGLRNDCRDLLQKARARNLPPSERSGLWSLIWRAWPLIWRAGAAGAFACALLLILPQPSVCAYLRSPPAKTVSAANFG